MKIIEAVCKKINTGICLRIEADDMEDVADVNDKIDRLLKLTDVPIDRCDLLVDMKELKKVMFTDRRGAKYVEQDALHRQEQDIHFGQFFFSENF